MREWPRFLLSLLTLFKGNIMNNPTQTAAYKNRIATAMVFAAAMAMTSPVMAATSLDTQFATLYTFFAMLRQVT